MKSLRESLFDSKNQMTESLFDTEKNITKDTTFGDLFKFESFNIVKNITDRSTYQDLSKSFSVGRIKKVTNIQGKDKNETIYKGLVHIIENIKFIGDPDDWGKEEIRAELKKLTWNFFQYSLGNYKKMVYVDFYNHGSFCLTNYSIFDHKVNEVIISLGSDLTLKFIRK